jgi:ribosomal 50S subunit-recycling heat shock protein
MRIDKFLKNARIIKRRTLAKEACDKGRVLINGKTAKAGAEVEVGDVIEIIFGEKPMKIRAEKLL